MKNTTSSINILLLVATSMAWGQTVVDLSSQAAPKVAMTAQRTSTILPDGKKVPMWGYVCTNSGITPDPCAGGAMAWAPGPTIIVKPGSLEIDLKNDLPTPTSIVILGQLGGGLGSPTKIDSPAHAGQTLTTWPASSDGRFTPPAQGQRVMSFGTETPAAGGTAQYVWPNLKPGTYLYETGTHPSIQAPMGLYGVLVVTSEPVASPFVPGLAHPGSVPTAGDPLKSVSYDADQVLLLSEIDPAQNMATDAANGDESQYPHAVDYKPLYFLLNGHAFDRTAPNMFPVSANVSSRSVLLRFVNAGLRTHVPSTVGLSMSLVAEDGNVLPGVPKVQNEILLTAGKTIEAVVNPPTTTDATTNVTSFAPNVFPIFDRQLSLSTNNHPDGGIQGYLQIAGGTLPNSGLASALTPHVVDDAYALPLAAKTFSNNVLANDVGIVNATLVAGSGPANGTVALNPDGTFTYTPSGATAVNDSFQYYGNGVTTMVATVRFNVTAAAGPPTAFDHVFTGNVQSLIQVPAPGILAYAADPSNYVLSAAPAGTGLTAGTPFTLNSGGNTATITLNADGSILASSKAAGSSAFTFPYVVTNPQGQTATANIQLVFPAGNGPMVTVEDAHNAANTLTDYKWTIEQDVTWPTDPTQGVIASNGTPDQSLGTNFHKSYMPLIATGCTGPISCGSGQSILGVPADPQPMSTPDQVLLPVDPTNAANNRFYISVLPADAGSGGHTVGGAPFSNAGSSVTVKVEPQPLATAQLSVFIFEDNNPTNGDADDGEPGLGGFQITLYDVRASTGDPAGQMTYDAYGMPLSNALLGTPDCPGSVPLGTPTGVIITCPDGSPLAGMALIKNLMPLRYDVVANPGAAREGKGETWYQVSTLEGTFAQDAFAKVGEPTYFQEFGAPGFHSFIGFINPDHIAAVNKTLGGTSTVTGTVTNLHMDRPPKINLWDSGKRDALNFTTCYVGLNSNDGTGANVAFAQCDPQTGQFTLSNVPAGTYLLVVWDQWLDQIIAYKEVTVPSSATPQTVAMGDVAVFSWFTQVNQSAFLDLNQDGIRQPNEPGISQIPMTIRFRDGSISNLLTTDSNGMAPFDQLFPLFNWYVVESDTTRFKGTKVAVSVDAGGPVNCTGSTSQNTGTTAATPSFCNGPNAGVYDGILNPQEGTGPRLDPGTTLYEGLQGFISQNEILDWGKTPYVAGETGGIQGMVYYASTRGFDDPRLEVQFSWEPALPRIPVNLYQKTVNPDGTISLKLVDSTTTSSWDDFAPGMHCPGQDANDPFVKFTIGQTDKCYDGMHNFNQVQPAVYDGRYRFPSENCTICVASPANNHPQVNPNNIAYPNVLPAGTYVVEVALPAGYEIVKEEDKNILMGDQWIAPVTQQFGALGNIFILPDQATLDESVIPSEAMAFPACAGAVHIVPDYLSLFPGVGQVSPFAGQSRNLCNRKEVNLEDQTQANADFQVFTPAPIAAHFTGMMLNDAASEFNQVSPSFGEKEALPNAPVSIKDFNGVEIQRVYTDKWGQFNGLTPSTWEANVPNPSGYSPNMLITCMNDPGPIPDPNNPGKLITDPMYNPMYSNFCYTWPFMPGITTYLDTPVLPVAAFASKYNPVDCAYPTGTPAVREVDGNGKFGPYLDKANPMTLTIYSLGKAMVPNPAYTGPQNFSTSPTANQKLIQRDFGFGAVAGTLTLGARTLDPSTVTWADERITVTLPSTFPVGAYELGITRGDNGQKSVDTVTVTVDDSRLPVYRAPAYVTPVTDAAADGLATPIQDAIDNAEPGDLILLGPGSYPELVIMWKPVRLQGVGASSVTINATKYPTQKLEQWRQKINTLFGIDAQGNQTLPAIVDPLPGQEITGGVVQLEPSVLSTEEGAGITVLGKQDLTAANGNISSYGPNSYWNHPSRIDGVGVTGGDSGGGIYVNGWAHNLEISNNRVHGNAGTYNGGIRVGQPYLEGLTGNGPFNFDANVRIHHNSVTTNGTVEANAAAGTAAAASAGAGGGLSICSGTDNYLVNYNFICGNFSSGDGGGLAHFGLSQNGTISNNKILFNQSYNQTSATNGGGLAIEGEPPTGATLSLGTGNVVVDSNLIQGNFAQGGSGGGIRLQYVNGAEASPNNAGNWYNVRMTNNMVVNNVAGWAGGGISLSDALNTSIINNTVSANDSTGIAGAVIGAQAGPMTGTPSPAGVSTDLTSIPLLAAINASDPGPQPVRQPGESLGRYNHRLTAWKAAEAAFQPRAISLPSSFFNNIVWQNRSFFFDGSTGNAQLCASNNLSDATSHACHPLPANPTYACGLSNTKYWDLGVVGDRSAATTQYALNPSYSVLTDTTLYPATNTSADPVLAKQYCNGPRTSYGQYWEPQQPFLPSPSMTVSATLDEAGNFVSLSYGPLSQTDGNNAVYGDYHLGGTSSSAYNSGNAGSAALGFAPNNDYDNQARPIGAAYDRGADEYAAAGLMVTPAILSFDNQIAGTTSAAQTVTVTNLQAGGVSVTPAITGGGGFNVSSTTCAGSLAPNASCVVNVVFAPTGNGQGNTRTATLTVAGESVALTGVRINPGVIITPTALDFGGVALNTTSTLTFALTNPGATTTSVKLGTTGAPFSSTSSCGANLAAGVTCTVSVTFASGNSTTQQSSTITVTDGSGNAAHSQAVSVVGRGLMPQVYVTPNPIAFGNVPVNTTGSPQAASVTNGGVAPFTITSAVVAGNYTVVAGGTTCATGLTLNPGDNCVVNISFKPVGTVANQPGTLTVSTSAGNQAATLSGTRVSGALTASPNQVDFGTVLLNQTSPPQSITLTNVGTTAQNISIGNLANGFSHSSCTIKSVAVTSLPAGASCAVNVTYNSGSSIQTRTTNLQVNGVSLAGLSGSGSAVMLSPASLTFTALPIYTTSAPQTVTISNAGNTPLALDGLTFGGTNASQFSQTGGGTCGTSVASNASCTINVSLTPTAADLQSATLSLGSQAITLTGSGKYLVVSPTALSFSATAGGGNPATQQLMVTNRGNTAVTGIAVAVSDPSFITTTNCINLTSGASCTVSVTFNTPGAASTIKGSLTITYDQVVSTPEVVALTAVTQ